MSATAWALVAAGALVAVAAVWAACRARRSDADQYVSADTLRHIDTRDDRQGWTDGPVWRFPSSGRVQ